MKAARESFEIQVLREGRWLTESARATEDDARALAKTLLANKQCPGVRIVRNWLNRDGTMTETVLFEQKQAVKEAPVRINPIEQASPLCQSPRDYFGLESRMVINRLLRSYLDSVNLTPTEVMHSVKEMQRVGDKDGLLPSAVDMVATLQTKNTDLKAKQRRDDIFASLDQIRAQARRAESLPLPKLGTRFSETLAQVASLDRDNPEYLAMVVLSRELIGIRNFMGKLEKLCRLALDEPHPQALLLLDTVIADVLGANIVQELLGWQPSLGSAIISMLDLADGKFKPEKSEAPEAVDMLNELFSQRGLPASHHCLTDRAMRQLKSPTPLYRNDPSKEMEEYQRVLMRLLVPGGMVSGAHAAEAITIRGARFVEQGGASGRRSAIQATVQALPDKAHGVMYLAELSKSPIGDGHIDDIIKQLDIVFGARVIGELCRRSLSPKERLVNATGAVQATLSSALPDEIKHKVADHIDGVLERYLVEEQVIEKLDNPNDLLRDRAVRLVKFCGAGVLPEGKALMRARQRVVKLLRQPNFDRNFVQDIREPAKAEKALRDFHKLLVQAGFG